jgi:hypothetical protein
MISWPPSVPGRRGSERRSAKDPKKVEGNV